MSKPRYIIETARNPAEARHVTVGDRRIELTRIDDLCFAIGPGEVPPCRNSVFVEMLAESFMQLADIVVAADVGLRGIALEIKTRLDRLRPEKTLTA